MTFAHCPPPIALGQTKQRKTKPSEQPPPVRFKIKENNNVSERQIEVKPFKDGCEWEVSEFKLIFNSTAKQTGWDTPEKKQANFPCCLYGTAKERHVKIQEEREATNDCGRPHETTWCPTFVGGYAKWMNNFVLP